MSRKKLVTIVMEDLKEHKHKWYTFGCKDATYLTVKGDYAPLSFSEKIQLSFHTLMCKYCRRFAQQSKKINELFKVSFDDDNLTLPQVKKDTLNQSITEYLKK